MKNFCNNGLLFLSLFVFSCAGKSESTNEKTATSPEEKTIFQKGSFGYDKNFLQKFDSIIILRNPGEDAQVIVSPKYQGKVFTSTADGNAGKSFGWINYNAFVAPLDSHMNAYGGENRFWLGPEGGPFSLFFPGGAAMTFANWKTPSPIDTEPWPVLRKEAQSVHLQKNIELTNYAGTQLSLTAGRTITILNRQEIETLLQQSLDTAVKFVGYRTTNMLTNAGTQPWDDQTGAPCIWMLDMFKPSEQTTIIIPYEKSSTSSEKIATTDYFGQIPPGRVKFQEGVLFFKADGKQRGKLGLSPLRAKPVAGSYDAQDNTLTLTFFDVEKKGRYLNQEWTTQKLPFSGDAVNAYNDGPLEDGTQMGPFYEIESVSPAAFLKPGKSLTHQHTVIHVTGDKTQLDGLAKKWFGVSLATIEGIF